MALGRANAFSRFVMCGGISQYNAESKSGPVSVLYKCPCLLGKEQFEN